MLRWIGLCVIVCMCRDLFALSVEQRPQYHFLPPKNWMNDPNGPAFINGVYHLFYQYDATGASGAGAKHWGHAVSHDLVYWQHLPLALSPTPGSYDEDGVWSGSISFLPSCSSPLITYTGVSKNITVEKQAYAFPTNLSDPNLIEWEKSPRNPFLTKAPSNFSDGIYLGWRDPTTIWHTNQTNMLSFLLGSSRTNASLPHGSALLYQADSTKDDLEWEFAGVFFEATDPMIQGWMWECPDYYQLNHLASKIAVFKASCETSDQLRAMFYPDHYYLSKSPTKFIPDVHGVYDYSVSWYASKTFEGKDGKRILWGWLMEADSEASWVKRGWAGVQSLPREVSYDSYNNVLRIAPIAQLRTLRGHHTALPPLAVLPRTTRTLNADTFGDQTELEIFIRFRVHNTTGATNEAGTFGVNVRVDTENRAESTGVWFSAPQRRVNQTWHMGHLLKQVQAGEVECAAWCTDMPLCVAWTSKLGQCELYYNVSKAVDSHSSDPVVSGAKGIVWVNRTLSSLSLDTQRWAEGGAVTNMDFDPATGEGHVKLAVFLDHSVLEIFVNDGLDRISTRIYPTLPTSIGTEVFANADVQLEAHVQSWQINSIW
eukprot:TRINITY_DN6076_c0_g1_i1.p1 TRINITY_DN6076_c0_g1~~TRINITY_DN6076_c0_g1_i1.p1  ORF type:complete len:598 (-),score=66.09 TRINITY_DN6076_c0_g1_i1:150-1943(-)